MPLLRKELDPWMEQFKETEPEFHAKSKVARRIMHPATNSKPVQAPKELKKAT
jgi:hypothetical protein